MKKIVSTFLLLFAVCGASAQLHVDLRVGASASMLSEQHLKLGLRGGVNIGYLFDEHFGLRTGLCYVMKGATTSSDVFDCKRPCHATLLHRSAGRGDGRIPTFADIALRSPRRSLPLPTVACQGSTNGSVHDPQLGHGHLYRVRFHRRTLRHRPRSAIRLAASYLLRQ